MLIHRSLIARLAPDNKVKDIMGRDLGRVEEMLLDASTGQARFAIVSFGGFFGDSDRLLAVPWRTLDLDPSTYTYTLCVDRRTLRLAPKFDRGERSRLSPSHLHSVEDHYSDEQASHRLSAA